MPVAGGFADPLLNSERLEFLEQLKVLLDSRTIPSVCQKRTCFPNTRCGQDPWGHHHLFPWYRGVRRQSALYDGKLRLMKADGSFVDFSAQDYIDYLGEAVVPSRMASFRMPAVGMKAFPSISTIPRASTGAIVLPDQCLRRDSRRRGPRRSWKSFARLSDARRS